MYTVYVIQSQVDKCLYVGMTGDLNKRLDDHKYGRVFSTKGFRPWELVYTENYDTRREARAREKYLKSGFGKEFIKQKLNRRPG